MGKSRRNDKDFDKYNKIVHENKKLKRQINVLRKQLSRIDLDRYSHVKDIIDEHYQEDRADEGQIILDKIKQEWKCYETNCEGYLQIIRYTKINVPWYYRQCSHCNKRTAPQKWSENVKGIRKYPEKKEQ